MAHLSVLIDVLLGCSRLLSLLIHDFLPVLEAEMEVVLAKACSNAAWILNIGRTLGSSCLLLPLKSLELIVTAHPHVLNPLLSVIILTSLLELLGALTHHGPELSGIA